MITKKRVAKIIKISLAAIVLCACAEVLLLLFAGVELWPVSILLSKKSSKSDNALFLTKDYPTEIVVYGDEISNYGDLPFRQAKELTLDELGTSQLYFYRALVINDREDRLDLTEEQLKTIDDAVNSGWTVYYIGRKYLNHFHLDYSKTNYTESDSEWSFGFELFYGDKRGFSGIWSSDDEKLICEYDEEKKNSHLINSIVSVMKMEIQFHAKAAKLAK